MKKQACKFSVITVSFNAGKTIEETILSVVNQRYENVEYIIIDGKSTDVTCDIISKYRQRIAYFVSEADKGIYDAMNKGLQQATGDFVIFLGADDHFVSYNILSEVAGYIQNLNFIYYGNVLRSTRNDLYCGHFNRYKLAVKNICHQAIFYPKTIYKQFVFNRDCSIFADYAYNLQVFDICKFAYIPLTISYFNDQGCSSHIKDECFEKMRRQLIVKHIGFFPFCYSVIYHCLRNFLKNKR